MPDSKPGARNLVERRERFIQRAIESRPETVDVALDSEATEPPQGQGPPNRHGRPLVPVGQRVVKNWPVLDLGHTPRIERAAWKLTVGGQVANPVTLDFEGLLELTQVEDESDFHCVTGWSRLDNRWRGVRLRDLVTLVVPEESARFVKFTGSDRAPGSDVAYTTTLPLERALDPDVLLVHTFEDEPLPLEHGGPVRVITPRLYAWKGTKWVEAIEFLPEDELGFWEVRGYSNTAEPWQNDRYSR